MELKRHQSDLTDTSKRALAANRGKSATLKSTYEILESEYKTKRSNLNAEQARFVRLMQTKLPAIKLSKDDSETPKPKFLTPPNSPLVGRQTTALPHLVVKRTRSKSFSDLPGTLGLHEQKTPQEQMTRQKSYEHFSDDELTEKRTSFNATRPRSRSALDAPSNLPAKGTSDGGVEKSFGNARAGSKHSGTNFVDPSRKHSSPARLIPLDINRVHETRKLTSKKPFDKQLEEVKDLRYLRTGKYSSDNEVTEETS